MRDRDFEEAGYITYSIAEARKAFSKILQKTAEESERVIITNHNKAVSVMVPLEDLALLEKADRLLAEEQKNSNPELFSILPTDNRQGISTESVLEDDSETDNSYLFMTEDDMGISNEALMNQMLKIEKMLTTQSQAPQVTIDDVFAMHATDEVVFAMHEQNQWNAVSQATKLKYKIQGGAVLAGVRNQRVGKLIK